MVIATTFDPTTESIGQHFGHATHIKLYELDDYGTIVETAVIETGRYGCGHAAMAELLNDYNVAALICQNIGDEAAQLLFRMQIAVFAGNTGSADEAVELLIRNLLEQSTESYGCNCGGNCGSSCGSDCGSGGCGGCCHE